MQESGPQTPEQRTEEQIIQTILDGLKLEENTGEYEHLVITLGYGRKILKLYYHPSYSSAEGVLANISDKANSQPNETTLLYKALKRLLQNLSNQKKGKIDYRLITKNKNLIDWATAADKGKLVFDWNGEPEISVKGDEPEYVFTKTFEPEEEKL